VNFATVKDVVNHFLNAKRDLLDAGELSRRTWAQYKETCDLLIAQLGKRRLISDLGPDDFAALRRKLAKRWKPGTLGNFIQRARVAFNHAVNNELIDRQIRYGQGFNRPSKKTLRLERAKQGPKLFTSDEIRPLIDAAGVHVKAMLWLAINCGFGNADCGRLPLSAIDLNAGWVDYPRPKTGIARRCPLWNETRGN
jgi:integrase